MKKVQIFQSIRERARHTRRFHLLFLSQWPLSPCAEKAFRGSSHGWKSTQGPRSSITDDGPMRNCPPRDTHTQPSTRLLRRNASGHPHCGSLLYFLPSLFSFPLSFFFYLFPSAERKGEIERARRPGQERKDEPESFRNRRRTSPSMERRQRSHFEKLSKQACQRSPAPSRVLLIRRFFLFRRIIRIQRINSSGHPRLITLSAKQPHGTIIRT